MGRIRWSLDEFALIPEGRRHNADFYRAAMKPPRCRHQLLLAAAAPPIQRALMKYKDIREYLRRQAGAALVLTNAGRSFLHDYCW